MPEQRVEVGQRRLVGRCRECGTRFDVTTLPEDRDPQTLPCQAVIGNVKGIDRPFVVLAAFPPYTIRTEQGVTPIRPCRGLLVTRYARLITEPTGAGLGEAPDA